jgi:hypothetical protein
VVAQRSNQLELYLEGLQIKVTVDLSRTEVQER